MPDKERKRILRRVHIPRYFERRAEPVGTPPGTLLPPKVPRKVKITVIDYTKDDYSEFEVKDVEECARYKDTNSVTWINLDGVEDVDSLRKLGQYFGVHPLALEDIQDVEQRPKIEVFDDFLLIIVRLLRYDGVMDSEQIGILLGSKYVITVQEMEGDCFDPLRSRLRNKVGRIRIAGADYLAYAILDLLTDEQYPILESFGDQLDNMEKEIVENPQPTTLRAVHQTKRDLLLLRRSVWPQREIVNKLMRDEVKLVTKETKRYLRDCYDHIIQVIDMTETYRDMSSGLQDLYMSSISNRMNEVMKVLTIIATIFIPLSFIVGLYGMNFNTNVSDLNMPELNWEYGYVFSLAVMLLISVGMLLYFRRKRWL